MKSKAGIVIIIVLTLFYVMYTALYIYNYVQNRKSISKSKSELKIEELEYPPCYRPSIEATLDSLEKRSNIYKKK